MDDVTIREASPHEVDAVLGMYEWLLEPPGHRPQAWREQRAREALAEAIAAGGSAILVAECAGGELVGIASAYLDLNSVRFGPRCWVEDLAVDPRRRSEGIGAALLDAAKAWARRRGATHLELDTGLAREGAPRFYERQRPSSRSHSYSWTL